MLPDDLLLSEVCSLAAPYLLDAKQSGLDFCPQITTCMC